MTTASNSAVDLSIPLQGGSWGELIPKTELKLCLRENWLTGLKKDKKQSELTCKQGTGGWEHAREISYLAFFMCPILILTASKQN